MYKIVIIPINWQMWQRGRIFSNFKRDKAYETKNEMEINLQFLNDSFDFNKTTRFFVDISE